MKVLIYKRTHKGDPDERGIFGNQDCMGRIRNWGYDAVVGIGGKTTWKGDEGIKHKINWIGLGPTKSKSELKRGDNVVFSHFELFEEKGLEIKENFPFLFEYMYGSRKRFDMSSELPKDVFLEVENILESVKNSPPSPEFALEDRNELECDDFKNSTKCGSCFDGKNIEITIEDDDKCYSKN